MDFTILQLKCETELELDLILELMSEYDLSPQEMKKTDSGIDLFLKLKDSMDMNFFYSKLMLYDIPYSTIHN